MTIPSTYAVGGATITRIAELTAHFPTTRLFPAWTAENATIGADHGMTAAEIASGQLEISVHVWLVRTGPHVILVDTGVGNGKSRKLPMFNDLQTSFLDHLANAGVAPDEVTHVLLTHLHSDHVGWNTVRRGDRWVPTFPNARTFMPQLGYDWFATEAGDAAPNQDMFRDSVLPIVQAGTADFVPACGGEVMEGISFHPTPGHSRDHMSIILRSAGEAAIFAGDVLHHPVQVAQPDLSSMFCADPALARASRHWALDAAVRNEMAWFSSHFRAPSVGRVSRAHDVYRWIDIQPQ